MLPLQVAHIDTIHMAVCSNEQVGEPLAVNMDWSEDDEYIDLENIELSSDEWPESTVDEQSDGEADSQIEQVLGECANIATEIPPEWDPAQAKELEYVEPIYFPEVQYETVPEYDPAHAQEMEYAEPMYIPEMELAPTRVLPKCRNRLKLAQHVLRTVAEKSSCIMLL